MLAIWWGGGGGCVVVVKFQRLSLWDYIFVLCDVCVCVFILP